MFSSEIKYYTPKQQKELGLCLHDEEGGVQFVFTNLHYSVKLHMFPVVLLVINADSNLIDKIF